MPPFKKPTDRTPVHKRALSLYDVAARLCRDDATMDATGLVAAAAVALREAQHVTHGPDYHYHSEVTRVTAMLDPIHDNIIRIRTLRGEIGPGVAGEK